MVPGSSDDIFVEYTPNPAGDARRHRDRIARAVVQAIPATMRLKRQLDLPPAMGELELRSTCGSGRTECRARRRPSASWAEAATTISCPPWSTPLPRERVLHVVHALPARGQPGQPAGDVRVSDADLPTDRHGRVERQSVRRRQRDGRGGADGMNATGRAGKIVVPATLHPEYRQILQTYLANLGTRI